MIGAAIVTWLFSTITPATKYEEVTRKSVPRNLVLIIVIVQNFLFHFFRHFFRGDGALKILLEGHSHFYSSILRQSGNEGIESFVDSVFSINVRPRYNASLDWYRYRLDNM